MTDKERAKKGEEVRIGANTKENYEFIGWESNIEGLEIGDRTKAETYFIMRESNVSIWAVFEQSFAKKEYEEGIKEGARDFKFAKKLDVPVNKTWNIKFNREIKESEFDKINIRFFDKDNKIELEVFPQISLLNGYEMLVRHMGDYMPETNYEIIVRLLDSNGEEKVYRMEFTTAK